MLLSTKAAVARKISWASRGRRGAASASSPMARHAATKNPPDIRFSVWVEKLPRTGHRRCWKKYQMPPQSAPRVSLKV